MDHLIGSSDTSDDDASYQDEESGGESDSSAVPDVEDDESDAASEGDDQPDATEELEVQQPGSDTAKGGSNEERERIDALFKDFIDEDISPKASKQTSDSARSTTGDKTLTLNRGIEQAGVESVKVGEKEGSVEAGRKCDEQKHSVEVCIPQDDELNSDELPLSDHAESADTSAVHISHPSVPVDDNQNCQASSSRKRTVNVSSNTSLGNVVGCLSKKPRVSVIEKAKLDWSQFKEEENLQEELSASNRGKEGYIDRMEFLDRADHRHFEREKQARNLSSKKKI